MAGDKDVFVHISAVERAWLLTLNENQVVEYMTLWRIAAKAPRKISRSLKLRHDPRKQS
jgi:hypothetical protein